MPLPCGSNPLLQALNAAKKSLTDKVNSLVSQGKGALTDLQAKANAMKAKLLAMLPAIPKLPNFKTDLAAMIGNTNAQALADFQKKWGKAVSGIQAFIDKLPNIDFCSEVPNVDGKLQPDGTYAPVVKAQDSPTPSENAEGAVALTSTVQDASTEPSAGDSGATQQKFYDYCTTVGPQVHAVTDTLVEYKNKWIDDQAALIKSKPWRRLIDQVIRTNSGSVEEYVKTHTLTPDQATLVKKVRSYDEPIDQLHRVVMIHVRSVDLYQDVLAGFKPQTDYDTFINNEVAKDNYAPMTLKYINPDSGKVINNSNYKDGPAKMKAILDENKDLSIAFTTYLRNKAKS